MTCMSRSTAGDEVESLPNTFAADINPAVRPDHAGDAEDQEDQPSITGRRQPLCTGLLTKRKPGRISTGFSIDECFAADPMILRKALGISLEGKLG